MTLATYEEVVDAEIVLSDSDAEDFDTRFQVALGTYAEARQELIDCVEFVRNTNIAERMGFRSRGDYIAARVSGLNVKWAVEDRRSLVELMAYPGDGPALSLPQIKDALGVGLGTVHRDKTAVESTFPNGKVEREVESSDGKTRTYTTNTDWPAVPEPDDYTEPTPEEKVQRFEETRQRLIDQGLIPRPRTQEEDDAAAERFVQSLTGQTPPRARAPETPEAKLKTLLNEISKLLTEGATLDDLDGLTEAGREAYAKLTKEI